MGPRNSSESPEKKSDLSGTSHTIFSPGTTNPQEEDLLKCDLLYFYVTIQA